MADQIGSHYLRIVSGARIATDGSARLRWPWPLAVLRAVPLL